MITDFETNTIYFAKQSVTNSIATGIKDSILQHLRNEGVQIFELNHTNDIWARDFMPVQIAPNKFVKFKYSPNYLQNRQYIETSTSLELVLKNCAEMGIDVKTTDINIDGGNFVKCSDKVILTDKILRENPSYTPLQLLSNLEDLLECEVLLIPYDPYDVYGHADGILRYMGNNELLLTEYPDAKYIKLVQAILKEHGFTFRHLHVKSTAQERSRYLWAYINYIQTKDFILLPALSEKCNCKEDLAIMEQFSKLFPSYAKKNCIIQVYTLPLLRMGGGLHCCSWNILKD